MSVEELEVYIKKLFPNGGQNTFLGKETINGEEYEVAKNESGNVIMIYYRRDTGEKIKVFGNDERLFPKYEFYLEDDIKLMLIRERFKQNVEIPLHI